MDVERDAQLKTACALFSQAQRSCSSKRRAFLEGLLTGKVTAKYGAQAAMQAAITFTMLKRYENAAMSYQVARDILVSLNDYNSATKCLEHEFTAWIQCKNFSHARKCITLAESIHKQFPTSVYSTSLLSIANYYSQLGKSRVYSIMPALKKGERVTNPSVISELKLASSELSRCSDIWLKNDPFSPFFFHSFSISAALRVLIEEREAAGDFLKLSQLNYESLAHSETDFSYNRIFLFNTQLALVYVGEMKRAEAVARNICAHVDPEWGRSIEAKTIALVFDSISQHDRKLMETAYKTMKNECMNYKIPSPHGSLGWWRDILFSVLLAEVSEQRNQANDTA